MLFHFGLTFFFKIFFIMWIRWNWNVNKFKKTDNIKKFHISYTIRLFFFFHRFSFLALFQLQKHYQWDPSLDALVKVAWHKKAS